jgi:hypothetical protein
VLNSQWYGAAGQTINNENGVAITSKFSLALLKLALGFIVQLFWSLDAAVPRPVYTVWPATRD